MNEEKVNNPTINNEAPKEKQPQTVRYYRAFLINCLNLQAQQENIINEYEAKIKDLLKHSQSKEKTKALRQELLRVSKERKQNEEILTAISHSIQTLNEYESILGISYRLTNSFIAKEGAKYIKATVPEGTNNE